MNKISKKAYNNSLVISILYVGLGTISVLCLYPPYYADWVLLVALLTIPVNFISFGLMFSSPGNWLWVLLIQLFVFFLTWRLVYKWLKKKY
ncbi:hypothetical protein [Sphingobacterium sp. LRF_L2]|uniref:hypothetical protein n=1 Tax=Sphingobacterium sp. LRF_L2 TaxID=3369421 RepID=UPI003F60BB38